MTPRATSRQPSFLSQIPVLLGLSLGLLSLGVEPAAAETAEAAEAAERVAARLLKVVDGDTLEVLIDGKREKVRVVGIDSPEKWPSKKMDRDLERTSMDRATMSALGRRASKHMKELSQNKPLTLVFPADRERRDRYGRLLAYVEAEGDDLGASMLRDGYAYPYRRFPHPRLELYDTLFRQAVEGKAGLWAEAEASRLEDQTPPKRKKPGKRKRSRRGKHP